MKLWLMLLATANVVAIIAAPIVLVMAARAGGQEGVSEVVLPVGFGLIQAILNLWLILDPLRYILAGGAPRPTMRNAEVLVLVLLAVVTFVLIEG